MQKMHIANSDKPIELYNLDVIISVGYRVKSQRGVEFRRWATQILKQYLMNGYAINNSRLDAIETKIKEPLIFLFNFVYFFIFQKKFL